ncbi:MAG: MG2 domain-containing protein, partial [Bradymonadaceae bacterium]
MKTNTYWKEWLFCRALVLGLIVVTGACLDTEMGSPEIEAQGDGRVEVDAMSGDDVATNSVIEWGELFGPQATGVDSPSGDEVVERPAALRPRLETVGASDRVPERIQIHFGREVFPASVTQIGNKSELVLAPEVAGRWRVDGPSLLTFVPDTGFLPGEAYTVQMKTLEVPQLPGEDGEEVESVMISSEKPWEFSFESPAFDFLGAVATAPDSSKVASVQVTLSFSAAVRAQDLAPLTTWTVDGRQVTARYARGNSAHLVVATVQVGRIALPPTLGLKLKEGLEHTSGAKAGAHELDVSIDIGKPMEILSVELKEGQDNYYVEVKCHDSSVKGTRYDYQIRRRVSQRCAIDASSARNFIEVHPKTNFRVTPAAQGFHLLGNFDQGSVTVRLRGGLRTEDDGVLNQSFEQTLDVPALSQLVQFTSKGRYLPRAAWDDLSVRHRNVDEIKVEVRHIGADNLVYWMSGEKETADTRTSDLILSRPITVANISDRMVTTALPLDELIGPPRQGVMEVTVSQGTSKDVVRLLATDMNLVVKRSESAPNKAWSEHVDVWAVHMETIDPMAAVEVSVVRPSGAVMARCATDRRGHCRLSLPEAELDKTPPFAIMARRNDDVTYLKYDELKTELARGDVHGQSYLSEQAYMASVYGDRDLYRPADTVKVVAAVRTENLRAAPTGMPVEIRLLDPKGQVMHRAQRKTNAAGLVDVEYLLSDAATTGVWRANVEIGKKEVATYRFNVEEFVPERMRVEARATKGHFSYDEPMSFDVHARYLFGASASGSTVELECEVEPATFSPRHNAQFNYGVVELEDQISAVTMARVEAVIGQDDTTVAACDAFGKNSPFTRTGRVLARASVFEAGSGRTTMAQARTMVHPESYYVGLQSAKKKLYHRRRKRAVWETVADAKLKEWAGTEAAFSVKETLKNYHGTEG